MAPVLGEMAWSAAVLGLVSRVWGGGGGLSGLGGLKELRLEDGEAAREL